MKAKISCFNIKKFSCIEERLVDEKMFAAKTLYFLSVI